MTTKLILTQDVAGLGAPGDVVEVKDGYARNYLVPRGSAIRWTKGAETQISSIKRARDIRAVQDLGQAGEIKSSLEALNVSLSARAGETGRLFGAVTTSDLVDAIKAAGGPEVDKRRIEVAQPIKTVGSHVVTVNIHAEVAAQVTVDVTAS